MYCQHCGKQIPEPATFCSECGKLIVEPLTNNSISQPEIRKRSGCLNVILILSLIGTGIYLLLWLFAGSYMQRSSPYMSSWATPLYVIIYIAYFVFYIAIWNWKKWGIYGYISCWLFSCFILPFMGVSALIVFISILIGVVSNILFALFLIRPIWKYLE